MLAVDTVCVLFEVGTEFLGAFAWLQKATINFVMSIRLSVRPSAWNNSAPTRQILMKLDVLASFGNMSRKFKFL